MATCLFVFAINPGHPFLTFLSQNSIYRPPASEVVRVRSLITPLPEVISALGGWSAGDRKVRNKA